MTSFRPNLINYKDFDFDFNKNEITKDVKARLGLSCISQSLKNIILTSPGERPFSEMGIEIYRSINENATGDRLVFMKNQILSAIGQREPRVKVEYNDVDIVRENGGKISINIRYAIVDGLGVDSIQNLNLSIE
jgi:phage baseplate assembly protein W